jgi:hypothetical protein
MEQTLKAMIKEVSPRTYCEAHKFLKDLADQAKSLVPPPAEQMADAVKPTANIQTVSCSVGR